MEDKSLESIIDTVNSGRFDTATDAVKFLLLDENPAKIRDIEYKYVIAGSHQQFEYWRNHWKIPRDKIKYIGDTYHIRGINLFKSYIFFWGLWYESPVLEHEREYLEFACSMIAHYSLGASVKLDYEFLTFCARYNIQVSEESVVCYFARHSNPNEELTNVKDYK
jgi:hypothetical protein